MKTRITVNEDHGTDGVEWSVSFDGYNTEDNSQTVTVLNKEEAFKLRDICTPFFPAYIIGEKSKSPIDDIEWLCKVIEPMLDEKYEHDSQTMLRIEDILKKYALPLTH